MDWKQLILPFYSGAHWGWYHHKIKMYLPLLEIFLVKYVEVTKKSEADNAYIKMNDLKGKKKTFLFFPCCYCIQFLGFFVGFFFCTGW